MKHNCMKAFALVAMTALSATVSAQVKTGMFVEVGPSINVSTSGGGSSDVDLSGLKKAPSKSKTEIEIPEAKSTSKVALELLGGYMWGLTDNLALGFATGVSENCKFNVAPSIPLLARAKYAINVPGKIVPFGMMDMGVDLNMEDFDYCSVRLNPTVGVDLGNFYVGAGYLCGIATKGGTVSHNINFKFGYSFDSNVMQSKAMKATMQFIKKTYVRLDVGYGFGLSSEEGSKKDITFGNNYSVHATWMYPVTDKLHVGIGTGIDNFIVDYDWDDDIILGPESGKEGTYNVTTMPFYLRGQYYVMETNFGLRPFVACNIGARARISGKEETECKTFFVEPQVGVEYKKFSLTAGYGFTSWKWCDDGYDDETWSGNSLNIRVGYRF